MLDRFEIKWTPLNRKKPEPVLPKRAVVLSAIAPSTRPAPSSIKVTVQNNEAENVASVAPLQASPPRPSLQARIDGFPEYVPCAWAQTGARPKERLPKRQAATVSGSVPGTSRPVPKEPTLPTPATIIC